MLALCFSSMCTSVHASVALVSSCMWGASYNLTLQDCVLNTPQHLLRKWCNLHPYSTVFFVGLPPTSYSPNWSHFLHQVKRSLNVGALRRPPWCHVPQSLPLVMLLFVGYPSLSSQCGVLTLLVCVLEFSAVFRLLLTGTPIQNSLQELYSLLSVVEPDLFRREQVEDFVQRYQDIEKESKSGRSPLFLILPRRAWHRSCPHV